MEFEFSRFDELMLFKSFFSYVLDIGFTIHTIYMKFSSQDDNTLKELYLSCFIISNVLAGIKSIQWYWLRYRDAELSDEEREIEEKKRTWILRFVFFFFSPLVRFFDVHRLGRAERRKVSNGCSKEEAEKAYKVYLEAGTTLYVLRFFEVFLNDAPLLTLQMYDHVISKGVKQMDPTEFREALFRVMKIVHKLYKMSDVMMSYTTKTKKWWHIHNREEYENCHILSKKKGTVNVFGKIALLALHFLQIASKCWCYGMLASFASIQMEVFHKRWLIYSVVSARWTVNSLIYFFQRKSFEFVSAVGELSRTFTAISVGGVHLFTFFSVTEGRQRFNILLFHFLNGVELLITFFVWNNDVCHYPSVTTGNATLPMTTTLASATTQTGDYDIFNIASLCKYFRFVLLALWAAAIVAQVFYYVILHPSLPSLSCGKKSGRRVQAENEGEEMALREVERLP